MKLGNVMIFGDSYSTYEGYISAGYAVYYSGNRLNPPLFDTADYDLKKDDGSESFEGALQYKSA